VTDRERVTSHLAGDPVTVEGRWIRQRCSWCGVALIDVDLELILVAETTEPDAYPTWIPGFWIRVLPGPPICSRVVDDLAGKLPVDACVRDVAPIVLEAAPPPGPPPSPGPLFDEHQEDPDECPTCEVGIGFEHLPSCTNGGFWREDG
jgi:hypothetical protein